MEERDDIQILESEEQKLQKMAEKQAEDVQEIKDQREAIEAIKKYTEEDDDMGELSLRAILGGDILQSRFFLKQVVFFMFCAFLMLLYTGNRYSSQQDAITIDSLRTRLQEVKYNVLTQSSELMNLSRQSNVERRLKSTKDSVLETPITPPFLIPSDSIK